jgi:hypothetical protein
MQAAQAQSLRPTLRSGTIEDAEECGRIMFEAFHTIRATRFYVRRSGDGRGENAAVASGVLFGGG